MSIVHFTADLHLGHKFVAGLRGFETVEEHDEAIALAWRRRVRPADYVWILGDLGVGNLNDLLVKVARLPGRKNLVFGNHDVGHPMHKDSRRYQRRYLEVFSSIQPFARISVGGQKVLLSHFPYAGSAEGDRGEERYSQWRLPDLGEWLLHGHTHLGHRLHEGNQIHVGWDAWDAPVSAAEIKEMMGR